MRKEYGLVTSIDQNIPLEVRKMGSLFAKKARGTLVATPSDLQCLVEGRLVSVRDWTRETAVYKC